ncbi:LPS-assembly lipoprotein LptE [Halopseudomonas oceani]|uniref:LPS-assembly lipoprotein LptE n=1 Tax=Halopseudomonas oceani TaxID=1708783 RepID=A0A2P4EXQ2_9GAMM|nr:LPS assembly lipoprotein LptE [Halopseudomonas oceani]POB05003.1 hypothetical protein C1949_04300 [Halopseudomonas oceani]GGE32328.1 LPS-assembly lipoprotein LptE [Halopseudomonas oceani]
MSLTTPRLLLSCAVLGATLLASGCGFHLRGTGVDSVELNQLDVTAHNRYGRTYQQVLEALEVDGVKVTPTAAYQLQLLKEDQGRRAVSYTSSSTPAEYELTSTLMFQIADRRGRALIGPETLATRRLYVNDKDNIIGTTEEEELLRHEMRQDLTRQLLFRLSSITEGELSSRESRLDQQGN